jgi:hypothetical protein
MAMPIQTRAEFLDLITDVPHNIKDYSLGVKRCLHELILQWNFNEHSFLSATFQSYKLFQINQRVTGIKFLFKQSTIDFKLIHKSIEY